MSALCATSVALDELFPPAFIALYKITSITAAYTSTASGEAVD